MPPDEWMRQVHANAVQVDALIRVCLFASVAAAVVAVVGLAVSLAQIARLRVEVRRGRGDDFEGW